MTAGAAGPTWVYVASSRRSGSTLLGVLLATATKGVNTGEMWQLWRRLEAAKPCQCGAAVGDCPVWSAVAERVRADLGVAFEASVARYDRHLHHRSAVARLSTHVDARDLALRAATESALERVTGASVFVDTSKKPVFLESALRRARPLVVVHLVRDPRGVAFSGLRPKAMPGADAVFPPLSIWRASARWARDNLQIERTLAHARRRAPVTVVRVGYEELAADPDGVTARVAALVERPPGGPAAPWAPEAGHGIAGNAALYERAAVALDRRWEEQMSRHDRAVTLTTTGPLLHHYGYSYGSGRRSAERPRATT